MSFIRVHALVHLLSPVDASLNCLHIYLALVSATLLGVGPRGGLSSNSVYTRLLAWLASAHKFYFSFTRCSPTPWMFTFSGLSAVSDPDSLLKAPLLRFLSRVQYIRSFWRVFLNGLVNLAVISAQSGLPGPPTFLSVSSLVAWLLFYMTVFSWKLFAEFCIFVSLCPRGSKIIGGNAPRLRSNVLGNSSP